MPQDDLRDTLELVGDHDGVAPDGVSYLPAGAPTGESPPPPKVVDGEVLVFATLADPAESAAATETIRDLRADLDEISPDIQVGGSSAILIDTRDTTDSDRTKVIPAILAVIFVVLALLLRSLLGTAAAAASPTCCPSARRWASRRSVFNHVFDFPASDPSTC